MGRLKNTTQLDYLQLHRPFSLLLHHNYARRYVLAVRDVASPQLGQIARIGLGVGGRSLGAKDIPTQK
jgi:hypothetical protein